MACKLPRCTISLSTRGRPKPRKRRVLIRCHRAESSALRRAFMEWDKIWNLNKKIIDPVAFRYTCVSARDPVPFYLENGPEVCCLYRVAVRS